MIVLLMLEPDFAEVDNLIIIFLLMSEPDDAAVEYRIIALLINLIVLRLETF